MYAIVIEWQDGTVAVNGPYKDEPSAKSAAHYLAWCDWVQENEEIPKEEWCELVRMNDVEGWWRIGDEMEGVDYYVRDMGNPVTPDQIRDFVNAGAGQ